MNTLLKEIEKKEYWDESFDRLMNKMSINTEELAELALMDISDYRLEFIQEVLDETFEWGIAEKIELIKTIGSRKKRLVYKYELRDRYIMGALYRAFSFYFRDKVSYNCFSYKRNVKTLDAIEYLLSDKNLIKKHGVKLDISAFFNSVSREYLKGVLDELFNSEPKLKKIMYELYMDDTTLYKGEIIQEYKSLIPGTSLSSFISNYCLREIDNLIADKMGITYARYSDDIIMFADTPEELNVYLQIIKDGIKELGLEINEEKYEWIQPGDEITYLGLTIKGDRIDIAKSTADKFKRKIKQDCRRGAKRIEIKGKDPYNQARKVFRKYNKRVYKTYIEDESKFGWAYYVFRYINTMDTIRELDFYLKDRVRQMITGKNNSANIRKVPNEMLEELGYISLCGMYKKFREDFDMYCDTVDLIR